AIHVMLVLPDRHPALDLVDHPAAGLEAHVAVPGRDPDPYRQFADGQLANAMHAYRLGKRKPLDRLLQDPLALRLGQLHVGLVAQPAHRTAVVVVAHPALEHAACARCVVLQPRVQRSRVEGLVGDLEALHAIVPSGPALAIPGVTWPGPDRPARPSMAGRSRAQQMPIGHLLNALAHPPLTGGMKAISAPSRGASSQRANAPSTATRRRSAGSLKPWRPLSSPYSARKSAAAVANVSRSLPAASRRLAK